MKFTKLLLKLLAICALVLALTACGAKIEEPVSVNEPVVVPTEKPLEESVEEEPIANMINPIVEFSTVEDAVIHVGHLAGLPTEYEKYNQRAQVISDTLIEIIYANESGDEVLRIREKAGTEEDISGIYGDFAYIDTFEDTAGNIITMKGDVKDSVTVVIWNDGKYAHAIDYKNGVTFEEVQAVVEEIK